MPSQPNEDAASDIRNAIQMLTSCACEHYEAAGDYHCYAQDDVQAIEDRLTAALAQIAALEAYAAAGWQRAVEEQDRRVQHDLTWRASVDETSPPLDYVIPGEDRPLTGQEIGPDGE